MVRWIWVHLEFGIWNLKGVFGKFDREDLYRRFIWNLDVWTYACMRGVVW